MKMQSLLKRGLGQGMTEYIIIVALIAIAAIGTFSYFGQTAKSQVASMAQELAGQTGDTDRNRAGSAAGQARSTSQQANTLKDYGDKNVH